MTDRPTDADAAPSALDATSAAEPPQSAAEPPQSADAEPSAGAGRAAAAPPGPATPDGPPVPGLELVAARALVETDVEAVVPLGAGDRALVEPGQEVAVGTVVVERLRDPRIEEVAARQEDRPPRPGDRWSGRTAGGLRHRAGDVEGELFAPHATAADRWRIVTAEHRDPVETPVRGTVREVRPGVALRIRMAGRFLRGILAVGSATRGRLEVATDATGELRPGAIDVGRAGTVLVVGARIDAEALTRARAMGVRGVVVASLAGKDLRDLLASERRQRAALHPTAPFGVLVLDGVLRRPMPGPTMGLLEALAGHEVAIIGDPPGLVFDVPGVPTRPPHAGHVRVRHGPLAGREGMFLGLAGIRRYEAGVHLEAGWVRLDDSAPVALPLADLERYV